MTETKGPRKAPRGAEKREVIVQAFMDAMYELGLERASMGEVGHRAGLDRTTIHYYFRTRDELLSEAAQAISRSYAERMERDLSEMASGSDRVRQVVGYMFSGQLHQPYYSRLIDELGTAGNRNPAINQLVSQLYAGFEQRMLDEIDARFPNVPSKRRREVAYALAQLAEGASVYVSLAFPPDRLKAARTCAFGMLDALYAEEQEAQGESTTPLRPRAPRET